MTFLGLSLSQWAVASTAVGFLFWILSSFRRRFHPDTILLAEVISSTMYVIAGGLWIAWDEQNGYPLLSVLWVLLMALSLSSIRTAVSRWLRVRAEELR